MQLSGVQGAADHELRLLLRTYSLLIEVREVRHTDASVSTRIFKERWNATFVIFCIIHEDLWLKCHPQISEENVSIRLLMNSPVV